MGAFGRRRVLAEFDVNQEAVRLRKLLDLPSRGKEQPPAGVAFERVK